MIKILLLQLDMLGFKGTNLIYFGAIQQIALTDIQILLLLNYLILKHNYLILQFQVTIKLMISQF